MSNETATPTPAPTRNWNDQADQRAAARDFLLATVNDPTLRNDVKRDRPMARRKFGEIGKIGIPDDVEVICLEPSTQARAKLVVFALPQKGEGLPDDESTLRYWLAAWVPY